MSVSSTGREILKEGPKCKLKVVTLGRTSPQWTTLNNGQRETCPYPNTIIFNIVISNHRDERDTLSLGLTGLNTASDGQRRNETHHTALSSATHCTYDTQRAPPW